MSHENLTDRRELLACPRCKGSLEGELADLACGACGLSFGAVRGAKTWPILVDDARSVVDPVAVAARAGGSPIRRRSTTSLRERLKSVIFPENDKAGAFAARLVDDLASQTPRRPTVLVVGGGQIGSGLAEFYRRGDVDVLAFDIYASDNVDFIADAHDIPLADGSVDGVIIQAVLEHVLEPRQVVDEIHRVLRPGGMVYADSPFMQQVHEGAYDFTRFTESGHRYLFRDFELVSSGVVAGLGTQLLWALDYFAQGVTRRRGAGRVVRLLFFWLTRLDRFIPERFAVDGASSVYFYGRRSDRRMSPVEAVRHYRGAQRPE